DEFPTGERLQSFHPTISQRHRNRRRGAMVLGIAVVAHFRAEIKKRQQKRNDTRAVKRVYTRRSGAKELKGLFDQEQRCAVRAHWRSTFNVRRSAFGVRHLAFGVWRLVAVTLSWPSYFAVRFFAEK